jgi:hypothetical protein
MTNTEVKEMTSLELITDRLEHIENSAGIVFATAQTEFQRRDTGEEEQEPTTSMKLLTDIGQTSVAIKLCCNKIKTLLEILNDIEKEEQADG